MSASDLAATLRRLHEAMQPDSATPWKHDASPGRGWVIDQDTWSIAGVEDSPECPHFPGPTAEFVVWCANNAEALATALERGAAAEAVVEAWRSYEVLSNAGTAKAFAVLAAYDALTETPDV